MVAVVIPFAQVAASQNPNFVSHSGSDTVEAYLRSAIVTLCSIRRFSEVASLKLVSNAELPRWFVSDLEGLGASAEIRPFIHEPPEGFTAQFAGSLFLLDVLEDDHDSECTLLLDPDVIFLGDVATLAERCTDRIGVLPMHYDPGRRVNGISAFEAREIHARLGSGSGVPRHYGGEVYVIPASLSSELRRRASIGWSAALEDFSSGASHFVTEEHVLNFALRDMPSVDIDDAVKRVWTAHRFRNVDRSERSLLAWHLPAEKDRGFQHLYAPAVDRGSWFWKVEKAEYVDRVGRAMGLHHRGAQRWVLDILGQAIGRREK